MRVLDSAQLQVSSESAVVRGRRGEDLAAAYLEAAGYLICARNFRCAGGEIDLIAYDQQVLCFIEVRARSSLLCGHPLESITYAKQRRIVRAAAAYAEHLQGAWPAMRFDALGIVLHTPPEFTLVRAAFEAF